MTCQVKVPNIKIRSTSNMIFRKGGYSHVEEDYRWGIVPCFVWTGLLTSNCLYIRKSCKQKSFITSLKMLDFEYRI